jgi:hypothetical protein
MQQQHEAQVSVLLRIGMYATMPETILQVDVNGHDEKLHNNINEWC